MKHPPHIERLFEEYKELGKKLQKLITFLNSESGLELFKSNVAEHNLLCDQRAFMTSYYTILDIRVKRYEETLENAARKINEAMN